MKDSVDDKAFFEAGISRLMDRLYGTAMRFTRDSSDAEDLIGEALLKAWSNFHSLNDRKSFDGWMIRILSNTFISQWRRKKTRQEVVDEHLVVDDLEDTASLYAQLHQPFLLWWGTPEQDFLNNLLNEDIELALDDLPDNYRVVVVMVEILGFTYEETAASLEVPIGTVRSRLNRGRRQLQQSLWQNACDEGIVQAPTPEEAE